jgi:Holliday junction resolvasome RuvABC ATP-dependent DNA helicase subunit
VIHSGLFLVVPENKTGDAAMREREVPQHKDPREILRKEDGLATVVGQQGAVERLRAFATLYASGTEPGIAGHILFTGPEGIGKLTVARAFAAEYCGALIEESAGSLSRGGDLLGALTNLQDGNALVIKDIDRLPKDVGEFLYPAMTDRAVDFVVDRGMFAKKINVPLKRFVLLATARSPDGCRRELLDRFHLILPLRSRYSEADLTTICERLSQRKHLPLTSDSIKLFARAAQGSVRQLDLLLTKMAALGKAPITPEHVAQLLSVLGLSAGPAGPANSWTELDGLSGIEFERAITGLIERMGFRAEMTKASGDGGVDIVATLDRPIVGGKYLFQCKRFAPDNLVGAATVREFYGAVVADREAVKGILITTSGFTPQAVEFARTLPMELIPGDKLRELFLDTRSTGTPA